MYFEIALGGFPIKGNDFEIKHHSFPRCFTNIITHPLHACSGIEFSVQRTSLEFSDLEYVSSQCCTSKHF